MKVVYVIGPIRSRWGRVGRWLNLWRGREAAITLWNAGFAVICSHLNSATLRPHVDEDRLLVTGDLEIIKRCDFSVVIGDCRNSKGAARELGMIRSNCLPVYTSIAQAIKYEG